jgi:hypothetical protein
LVAFGKPQVPNNRFKPLWDSLSAIQKKELAKILGNALLTKAEMLKKLNVMVDKSDNKKRRQVPAILPHLL